MRVLAPLWVVLCGIFAANAASHSLKYVCTAVTGGTDSPEFTIEGLLDDEVFSYYDSKSRRMIPTTAWIRENEGADYWGEQTQKALDAHQTFKANVRIAMQHYSSTQVVHHFEYGCQRDDDTRDPGQIEHYEYHGKDVPTEDMKSWPFITPAQQLFISAVKWNLAKRKNDTQYLTQICVEALKKYVSYRMIALGRTVAPEVSLLQKEPSSPGVTCHVTRFYPHDITITWQRNGEDLDVDVELGETVPNEDGTFQTTSYLTVKPEDWKSQNYTCTVQHKSLKQDIILPVKKENINIAPEVSLLQKDSSSPGVTCHVTGFYPCDIMVTWQRNGEDLDVELGETVPNEDGTFQTTSNLTVKPEDWKSQNYTCTVRHKSLKQDIILPVKEENIKRNTDIKTHSPEGRGVIIGCVVGALILILGVVMCRKRSSDYGRTSTSDPISQNSNNMQLQSRIQQTPDQPAATDTDSGL
ncbi:H-2 class I histocompatibility antigen, Q8 alpha chain-like isoform X2 [Anguilla anguilla]|uniref:H-2 class I histocompatibility antigen, Q8 alpha chain-like isoform X2 n=1 Tax=Anguilla anguilla TaxID=7936 RepID=UPI0015ACCE1B|nr:H-2 class I histocompatibility antigen, Q8 alpha chain-like isoform X2 [Anguilla anguilla]